MVFGITTTEQRERAVALIKQDHPEVLRRFSSVKPEDLSNQALVEILSGERGPEEVLADIQEFRVFYPGIDPTRLPESDYQRELAQKYSLAPDRLEYFSDQLESVETGKRNLMALMIEVFGRPQNYETPAVAQLVLKLHPNIYDHYPHVKITQLPENQRQMLTDKYTDITSVLGEPEGISVLEAAEHRLDKLDYKLSHNGPKRHSHGKLGSPKCSVESMYHRGGYEITGE